MEKEKIRIIFLISYDFFNFSTQGFYLFLEFNSNLLKVSKEIQENMVVICSLHFDIPDNLIHIVFF